MSHIAAPDKICCFKLFIFSKKYNEDFFKFFSIAWQMVIEENIGGLMKLQ